MNSTLSQKQTIFDYTKWNTTVNENAQDYASRQPYPHIVLDNFLEPWAAEKAMAAFPAVKDEGWIHYVHVNEKKHGLNKMDLLPPFIRQVIEELNSPEFVAYMSKLTGIDNLLADDMLEGGGLHQSPGRTEHGRAVASVTAGRYGLAFRFTEEPVMKIAVMPGDYVGKEVVAEGLKVLAAAAKRFGFTYATTDYPFGAEHYLKTKVTLPDSALKELAAHDAILFGTVGADPRGNKEIPQGLIETDILLRMRFELDQYINLRPTRLLPGVPTPLAKKDPFDMVIVRENTEGLYCQNGGFLYKNTPNEVANQIEVTTRHGVERAIRYAFDYAKQFGRKKVTLVAKTNVLRYAHNLWMRAFEDVSKDYAGIETGYDHVDACTMYMVTQPQRYDVIVTTNMFGDIITDLGAAIQGGMGMAASGNLNPKKTTASMFEPVHGSTTDIAGKGFANPIATFLSVAMMLDFLEQPKAAAAINDACRTVIADAKNHTRDLGGAAGTRQITDAVLATIG